MILPGKSLIPKIISNVLSFKVQAQLCGVDLTLKRVLIWTSPGVIDFDNIKRVTASTGEMPFASEHRGKSVVQSHIPRAHTSISASMFETPNQINETHDTKSLLLPKGSYLVEFNEHVAVPLDLMGQIFVRSSLFRSGALISAGVMDAGYEGAVGAMLQVVNPLGLRLYRDARLAQIVFHRMSEPVEGYDGMYQKRNVN